MNDLIVREIMNGMLFMLGLFLVGAMGFRLLQRVKHDNDWYHDETTQAIIALFFFLIGENIRSGWIWALLICQNEYGRSACLKIASSYELLLVASAFAIVGAVCCIRVFSPPAFNPWTWLAAGALALLVPLGVHIL